MKQVLDVTRLLAVTSDLDVLLRRIAEATCALLACERASIWLHDAEQNQLWTRVALGSGEIRVPAGAGIVGQIFANNRVLHIPNPYGDARFNPGPDRKSGFVTRNILGAPMLDLDGKPVGAIQALNKHDGSFDAMDETMVELLGDQAGVAVQRYALQQQAMVAVAMRNEMDLAKRVQQAMIPGAAPHLPNIDAAGWSKTASITGGDCYDLWKTSDGRLGIFLADATGHGIGPAMVVSQTRTLIRALCDREASPAALLACANARLNEDLDAGNFVTAFVGFLSSSGRLDWCSAGHGPVLLRLRDGEPLQSLDAGAPPLGVLPVFDPDPAEPAQLGTGGLLCVCSDGITESFAPNDEQFSVERFVQLIEAHLKTPLHELIAILQADLLSWQQIDEPKDDQTLVIARMTD